MEIKNRVVQYPNDWRLVELDAQRNELGTGKLYRLKREEGTVQQQGTPLNAEAFKDVGVGIKTIWGGDASSIPSDMLSIPAECIHTSIYGRDVKLLFTVEISDSNNNRTYCTLIGGGYLGNYSSKPENMSKTVYTSTVKYNGNQNLIVEVNYKLNGAYIHDIHTSGTGGRSTYQLMEILAFKRG